MITESSKEARASELIKKFRLLVNNAESIAFPKAKNSLFLPINMEGWHPIRKFFYKMSTPYLYTDEKGWQGLAYLALAIFLFVMGLYSLGLAQKIGHEITIEYTVLRFFSLAFYFLLCTYSLIGFLRDTRYHAILKISLLVILGFTSLGVTANLFPSTAPHYRTITSFSAFAKVLFIASCVLASTALFFINTLLTALLIYIQLINYTESIQTPIDEKSVETLLGTQIIGETSNGSSWRLLDLSLNEIKHLRLWSESSLNSSEKRTIPAIVIAPLFGVLWSIDGLRTFLSLPFTPLTSNSLKAFPSAIALIFTMAFVVIFSRSMIAIFKNIAIQSLIVETCLVAEYAVEEQTTAMSAPTKSDSTPGNLFKMIVQKIAILASFF